MLLRRQEPRAASVVPGNPGLLYAQEHETVMIDLTGGCACGAVRYRLASAPLDPAWCHCRTCQLNSGSPAMAFATVPVADMIFEQGADLIGQFASSDFGHRKFCTRCGTPLLMEVNDEPGTLDFSLATLDDQDAVTPGYHIYYDSRIDWAPAGDDLPRHPRSWRLGD